MRPYPEYIHTYQKSGELKLLPDGTNVNIYGEKSYQGIYCTQGVDPQTRQSGIHCNQYTQIMINNITMNPSWDCHSRMEYTTLFSFEDQHFTLIFGFLISFAFASAFFTMIHDWRLIKHRRDLSKMSPWFPSNKDGNTCEKLLCFHCYGESLDGKHCDLNDVCYVKYHCKHCKCCNLSLIIMIFATIFIFLTFFTTLLAWWIFVMAMYLFVWPFICCTSNSWSNCKQLNGNICKISYLWIGLAKFGLMITTSLVTFYGFWGINVFIKGWYIYSDYETVPDCSCYCHYVLPPANFYALMIVTYALIINVLSFLYRETCKMIPNQIDYIMTKRYIAPISHETNILDILKKDPMQTMLYRKNKKLDEKGDNFSLMEESDEVLLKTKDAFSINVSEKDEASNGKVKSNVFGPRNLLVAAYMAMTFFAILILIVFTATGFVTIGVSNAVGLPHWLSQMIMWIGIVVLSTFILIVVISWCWGVCFNYSTGKAK